MPICKCGKTGERRGDMDISSSKKATKPDMRSLERNNPASECETFPIFVSAILCAVTVLCSLALPLSFDKTDIATAIAWLTCIAAGILCIYASRRLSTVILLSIVYMFILPYMPSPIIIAVIVGILAVSGLYSALVASSGAIHLPFLISAPILTYAAALILSGDVWLSCLSLVAFPPALVMGLSAKTKRSRAFSITAYASVAVAELLIAVFAHIYTQNGAISLEIIENAVLYLRDGIAWSMKGAIIAAGNSPITESISIQANTLANETVNSLAGLVVAASLTVGFAAQKIEHSLFERFELEKLQNESGATMTASLAAALIFAVAHILSFTSSSTYAPSFLATTSKNISLVLLPLLFYVGLGVLASLPKKIGFLALAAYVGLVILAGILSISIISVIALSGVFYTFFVNIDSWAKTHYSEGEDQ